VPSKGKARAQGFISKSAPEVRAGGLFIVEVGPGTGFLLRECMEFGNAVLGIEASSDSCYTKVGGDVLAPMYEKATTLLGLAVLPIGFETLLDSKKGFGRRVDVLIMQGSVGVVAYGIGIEDTVGRLCEWLVLNLAETGFAVLSFNDNDKDRAMDILSNQELVRFTRTSGRECRLSIKRGKP